MRPAEAPTTSTDSSEDELTAVGLVPRRSRYEDTGYPQVRWPWRITRTALAGMAETAPLSMPVVLRHVNPRTGDWPLRTMGSQAEWLRPAERTRAERRTGSGVFHVVEGRGESLIGETSIAWEEGDCFVAPPWHWIVSRHLPTRPPRGQNVEPGSGEASTTPPWGARRVQLRGGARRLHARRT